MTKYLKRIFALSMGKGACKLLVCGVVQMCSFNSCLAMFIINLHKEGKTICFTLIFNCFILCFCLCSDVSTSGYRGLIFDLCGFFKYFLIAYSC